MKRLILLALFIVFTNSLFADGSFFLFHDINLIPNLSTDFFKVDNLENPVEDVNIPATTGAIGVGVFITTFNTDMVVSYEIEWGNLEYNDEFENQGPYLPFTMEVIGDGNVVLPVTLNGSLGAGEVEIEDVCLIADLSQTWSRQYICGLELTFNSNPQFSRAGTYSTDMVINQIAI